MISSAPTGALENYANNFSPPLTCDDAPRRARRALRYRARRMLWDLSDLERVRKCGRVLHGESVALRLTAGAAGFAGVTTCGSVWADPVCNAKVMARRAIEVGSAVALWQRHQGSSVLFGTLTMRHHQGHSLQALWDALQAAWHAVIGGAPWQRRKARDGIAGWLRVVEVTYGQNGWHVHIHALFFLTGTPSDLQLEDMAGWVFARWSQALRRRGLDAASIGQDLRLLQGPADEDLARYFTKAQYDPSSIGLEVTASQSKRARTALGTSAVWAFLDQVLDGDADSLDRWHEWERVSRGRRQITWARGMRELVGLGLERDDEDIASEELGSTADDLLRITADGWRFLCSVDDLIPDLLTATETGGLSAARAFLDSYAVSYTLA